MQLEQNIETKVKKHQSYSSLPAQAGNPQAVIEAGLILEIALYNDESAIKYIQSHPPYVITRAGG